MTLTQEQIARYHEQGYLILRADEHKLVSPAELKAWTDEVEAWPRVRGKWMPYDEIIASGERQLMRTEKYADYHDGFKGLLFGEALTGLLGQLTGDGMLLFKDKINYKQARGNGFPAHLDAPAYDHIGRIEHVTANIAVDAATRENGFLEVVPGSHRMEVDLVEGGGSIVDSWSAKHEWAEVPLSPGDILIFGSHLAHRSGPNNTDDRRASVYATYHCRKDGEDLRERYYKHRRENFPPDHERDPEKDYTAGFKTYGFAAPFTSHDATKVTSAIKA